MNLKHSIFPLIFTIVYFLSISNMANPLIFGIDLLPINMHVVLFLVFLYSLISLLTLRKINKGLFGAFFLFFAFILPSVVFSEHIDVSILKFFSFFPGLFSLLFLAGKIDKGSNISKKNIYIVYRNINRIAVFLSLIVYMAGIGYPVNATGFSGILNHPQAFGIFLVLIILVELYGIQNGLNKIRWSLCTVFIAFIFSIMTESRLSSISVVLILSLYVFLYLKIKVTHLILLLCSIGLSFLFFNKIMSIVVNVITKSGRSSTSGFESLEESRGFLVFASLHNFKDHPIFGIGFQISNGKYGSYEMLITRDPFFGLPIEAAVEKGVFWSALLEETGIIGFFGFFMFVFSYYMKLTKKISLVILLAFILIGVGESFYFSLGGVGSFVWCIFLMFYATRDLKYIKP